MKRNRSRKTYFHKLMRDPRVLAMCKKYPLWWYSHMFLGMPFIDPETKQAYDYENLSNETAIKLKHYHLKWSILPEYENHTWDGSVDPLYKMLVNLSQHKWTGVSAATSLGKTWMMSVLCAYALTVMRGQVISVGVSFQSMLDSIWAEVKNKWASSDPNYGMHKLLPYAKMFDSGRIICDGNNYEESKHKYFLRAVKNEGEKTDSAGAVQGIHAGEMIFLVDETPKLAQSTLNAIMHTSVGERNGVLCVGNPDSLLDPLANFMALSRVDALRMSALDFPNVVCDREVIPGGAVSKMSVDDRRETLGEDNPLFMSRVRGLFPPANKNALLKHAEFKAVCRGIDAEDYFEREPTVGLDIASSENGDKAAISVFEDHVSTLLQDFVCKNAGALPANLILPPEDLHKYLTISPDTGQERNNPLPDYELVNIVDDYGATEENVIVDSVGLGESTVNAFTNQFDWVVYPFFGGARVMGTELERLLPVDNEGKPLIKVSNLRTLAFFLLVFAIRKKEILFNTDTIPENTLLMLYAELSSMQLDPGAGAGLRLEAKKKTIARIGKSPNLADAVMMANFRRMYNEEILGSAGLYS